MDHDETNESLFYLLGNCLEYPTTDTRSVFEDMERQILAISNMAAFHFQEFAANINKMTFTGWQEYYVKTFDVTPQCGLYISVHLFGEENYKRAELMTGLKTVYEKTSPYEMTELPDHLAVILKQRALFSEEEWTELAAMCLKPVVPKISALLEKNNNPYAFLLKTIHELLVKMEKVYA
ncbi:MAG: nitrate reductase molybdenum cofactor assembly chaperone [Candidatus Omnitrophica bacterium]|nr:nitrate reductase molybdenum cofactor assembly chaperone [Candidatus Omnitrophota bacterium]